MPSAGEREGAEPPRPGAGVAGATNLDTYGTSLPVIPSSSLPFGPLWLTLQEYRARVATELARLAFTHTPRGKRRRSFIRKARALRACGQFARVPRCRSCGALDAASACVQTDCDLRSCPTCARRRADVARNRLEHKWHSGQRPRRMSLYFLTFTLQYGPADPADLSVEGLRRRKTVVRDGVGWVWKKYLKAIGRAMAISVEVSPRGAVHVHALFHGRRPDLNRLRATYMFRVGASPFVNCKYVPRPSKAIREVAKYMMKAASPKNARILRGGRGEFIDPVLAARVEVALSGDRLFECLGAWRGADEDEDVPVLHPVTCAHCGGRGWTFEVVTVAGLLNELPGWIPRFGRAGPVGRTNPRPNFLEGSHV